MKAGTRHDQWETGCRDDPVVNSLGGGGGGVVLVGGVILSLFFFLSKG